MIKKNVSNIQNKSASNISGATNNLSKLNFKRIYTEMVFKSEKWVVFRRLMKLNVCIVIL